MLAGAGTGKTRVITYRVAHLIDAGVPAERILAVTFTNKAAGEMRRRIEELVPGKGGVVWVHTFHAFACRVLRRHHEVLKLPKTFTIYDQDDQKRLVIEAMKALGLGDQKNKAGIYVSIISRAKDDLLDAGSYAIYAMTASDPSRQTAARIYQVYQRKLDEAGALDFGDLLLKLCELLRNHKSVREYYQEWFLHLLVDEYQDTNHAQYILTKTLAAKHRNICVVGDDDQGVYSWRGANIRNILEFERDFPDAKVVTLEQNYRSTPRILEAAIAVIRNNKGRKKKKLWTQKQAGEVPRVVELPNEFEEARWVVAELRSQVDSGASLRDIVVFYRTNAQSRSFEEALRMAGLPYTIVGAMRFYERKEIKNALSYARVALNPADSAALSRILNVPPRGIGKTSQQAVALYAQATGCTLYAAYEAALSGAQGELPPPSLKTAGRRAVRELLTLIGTLKNDIPDMSPARALRRVLEASGYWTWLESEVETDPEALGRLNNLQELLNAAKEYEEKARSLGEEVGLAQYLEGISLQSDIDAHDETKSAVTLMTTHMAKGLEFPIVFLTGLEEGLFPIGSGGSPEDLEEERRLCYVGITRAREKLYLSYASTRRLFGHVYANLPSRFILEAQLYDKPRMPGAPAPRQALRSSPRVAVADVKVGMRVRHPDFGEGNILEKSGSGETVKVTVRFDSGRTTKLLVRYAPLEPA